jgi:hypothetical protein
VAQAPDDAVDRLYGLPLDAFVAERDALVRELRGGGRRDEAAAVKALAKPTVAAWAANQAVRSQARAARELWEAGDALAAAQEAVLGGRGSGADLREASDRERAAVAPLVEAARGLLTSEGGEMSEATLDRVRDTLHAAAIDSDARDEVAAGRATRERTPRGLFGGDAPPAPTPTARKGRGAKPPAPKSSAPPARKGRGAKPRAPQPSSRARGAEEVARKREEAAARKREREAAAAFERARKAAEGRVAKAEQALARAEARSATAAQSLEEARVKERAAIEALADARAELRAAERR